MFLWTYFWVWFFVMRKKWLYMTNYLLTCQFTQLTIASSWSEPRLKSPFILTQVKQRVGPKAPPSNAFDDCWCLPQCILSVGKTTKLDNEWINPLPSHSYSPSLVWTNSESLMTKLTNKKKGNGHEPKPLFILVMSLFASKKCRVIMLEWVAWSWTKPLVHTCHVSFGSKSVRFCSSE
jgi:hypothetical protein